MPVRRKITSSVQPLPPSPTSEPPKATLPKASISRGATKLPPVAIALIVIVLVTAALLGIRSVWHKGASKPVAGSPNANIASTPQSIKALISKVSRHIVVKQGEDPTVATIQDANVLRQQNPTFYKDAQDGDRLLIWSDKAVLYSTSRDIVLAVLPISLPPNAGQTANSATSTGSAQSQELATIEVRNGSGTSGIGKALATKLTAAGLKVLTPTDAKKTYAQSIIVKLTSKDLPQTLQALEGVTKNAQVTSLPAGENASKADFLVIVGADYSK